MRMFNRINSKNIDEFAEWLDKYCWHDNAPWILWFDRNYCKNCEGVTINGYSEYAYCEKYGKCRFFQEKNEVISTEEIVKIWLESECESNN